MAETEKKTRDDRTEEETTPIQVDFQPLLTVHTVVSRDTPTRHRSRERQSDDDTRGCTQDDLHDTHDCTQDDQDDTHDCTQDDQDDTRDCTQDDQDDTRDCTQDRIETNGKDTHDDDDLMNGVQSHNGKDIPGVSPSHSPGRISPADEADHQETLPEASHLQTTTFVCTDVGENGTEISIHPSGNSSLSSTHQSQHSKGRNGTPDVTSQDRRNPDDVTTDLNGDSSKTKHVKRLPLGKLGRMNSLFAEKINSALTNFDLDRCDPDVCVSFLRNPSIKTYAALKRKLTKADKEWIQGFLDADGLGQCLYDFIQI